MLRPHPLDDILGSPEEIDGFPKTEYLRKALQLAKEAFLQQQRAYDEHPHLAGPSPAQAARVALLEQLQNPAKPTSSGPKLLIGD